MRALAAFLQRTSRFSLATAPRFRWGVGLLGVALLAALVPPVYERFFGRQRLRFTYFTGQLADGKYRELAAKPGWAASKIDVEPEITLRGLVRRPPEPGAPWVIYYSGNDANMLETGQRFLTRLGGDRNWGLAVYAYRGFDSSGGEAQQAAIAQDAPLIVARLCEAERVPRERVHLVGFSIGGHFAVHAARGAAFSGQPVATLSLLASVDDIVMVPPSAWAKFSSGDDYQTRPLLATLPAPVLVVQGTSDEALGGPAQGRAIARALGDRAKYQELEGVGHAALLENEAALSLVRDLIEHPRP
jgi:pimeloyl-ACP methyl ester carboxylesterase